MIVCFPFPSPNGRMGGSPFLSHFFSHANFTENWKIYVLTRDLSSVFFFFSLGGGVGVGI